MKKRLLSLFLAVSMIFSLLPATALAADGDLGQVRVIVENTTYTVDEGAPWYGTLVDTTVDLTSDMTMMSAIKAALDEKEIAHIGADGTYISSINGLAEFDGGSGSGWKGTLNDWFVNMGFADWKVSEGELVDGDVIRVMYTQDMGADIGGEYGANVGNLSELSVSAGTLSPAFDRETLDYTLTVDSEVTSVDVTAVAENKEDKVTVKVGDTEYRRGENVSVANETVINVICGEKTYTLTVAQESTEEPEPEEPVVTTYTVTLPAETTGYTVAAAEGSASPVTENGSYAFTVEIAEGYEAGETFAVKANGVALTADNGVYTIESITTDQVITVEGVEEVEEEETATPFSQHITVPANGNSSWGYVSGLTLSGTDGGIYETYWSSESNPYVLDVILTQDTPLDATITAAFSVAGMRAPSISGETAVTLVDGKGTINVTVVSSIPSFYPNTNWTVNLSVDDGSAASRATYAVTLPTETVGYTVTASGSSVSPVIEGRKFSFTVTIDNTYKAGEDFAVKANGVVLNASNGVYTIENITADQTVTVEGVVEKTLAEMNVTIIAPAGSTISSGRFYSYFKYDFNEPLETATLEDGRLSCVFPVPGSQGFLRVQHPQGVTYWDFDGLNAGSVFEITADMLFIGSDEFTKETVYADFEKNTMDKADLYLTANEKGWLDLEVGESWNLNVFRNFLSLGNSISNTHVALPDMEYTVIPVNGATGVVTVTPNANNSSYAEIKAEKAGTAIILVTYDAVYNNDGLGGKQWSALWPENTGVIVVTVGAEEANIQTNMTVNEEANAGGKQIIDVEHDILFYIDNAGAEYSFKPEDGCTVTIARSTVGNTMTFNGFVSTGITTAEDGTVTVSGLTTGTHIIKVEKDGKAAYQVIRARQVSYELKHSDGTAVTAESLALPGETITVQFHNLISPLEKLSGVYNANFGFYYNGQDGSEIRTSGGTFGVYTFSGNENLQKFTFTVPDWWNEGSLTLRDGGIKLGGFGGSFGSHRTTTYIAGKEVNTNASGTGGVASVLPDIVIPTQPTGTNAYWVTLPEGEGYTATGGETPITEGDRYTFSVTVKGGYDGSAMTVKVNDETVTLTDGIYIVENVTEDLTITVEGVAKIEVDAGAGTTAVYTNGVDGSGWGRGTYAYVDTVSVVGAAVESYAWDGDTCNVVLSSDTAADAAVGFAVTFGGSNENLIAKMAATMNGTAMTAGEPIGIKLTDGTATAAVYAAHNNNSSYGGTKTFVLTVAEKETYPATFVGHTAQLNSFKVYTYADGIEGETDLLEGVADSDESNTQSYAVELPAGDYWVEGYDTAGNCSGGILVTVSEEGDNTFTINRVYQIKASNSGWVLDTDYTVRAEVTAADRTARVVEMGTAADYSGNLLPAVLCLYGDTVKIIYTPSEVREAENYIETFKSQTLTASSSSFSATIPQAVLVTFKVPAGSQVDAGRFHDYYVYDFAEWESKTQNRDGTLAYTYKIPKSTEWFYRVTNPQGVTYWNFGKWTDDTTVEITAADLCIGSEEFHKDTIYRYEKNVYDRADIYLNINGQGHLTMEKDDTFQLNVFRNWMAIESFTNAKVALPDMHYQVIDLEGNPSDLLTITPDANNSSVATLTAKGEGTAIVLVTYDAMTHKLGQGGTQFSAIWPECTGVFIVTVGGEAADIDTGMMVERYDAADTALDAEHDILFYLGDEGADFTFTPEEGTTVTVNRAVVGETLTFKGFTNKGVTTNEDGTVTVSGLTSGRHIIKVEKGGQAVYQVVTARGVSYQYVDASGNELTEEQIAAISAGDTVYLQFNNLVNPAEKLSGAYNFNASILYYGEDDTSFRSNPGSNFGVYDFSGNPVRQKIAITIPQYWEGDTYTLNGAIKMGGFGNVSVGGHRGVTYASGLNPNFNAASVGMTLSAMPEITIKLASTDFIGGSLAFVDENGNTIAMKNITKVVLTDENGNISAVDAEGKFNALSGTYNYVVYAAGYRYTTGTITVPENMTGSIAYKLTLQSSSAGAWDGVTAAQPQTDENGVYLISNGNELAWFAATVNSGGTDTNTISGKLTADIDLAGYPWTPIGGNSTAKQFKGTLDGDGHAISNLYVNATTGYSGLFGYAGSGAVIKNLSVSGTVNSAVTSGNANTAGVVGYAYDAASAPVTLEKVTSDVTVTSVNKKNYVAGIAGYAANTTITNCANLGAVTSDGNYVAGIAGYVGSNCTITGCYNAAAITGVGYVGGILGYNGTYAVTLTACYNTGAITATGTYNGGIAGWLKGASTVSDVYNVGAVTGGDYTESLFGVFDTAKATLTRGYSLEGSTDTYGTALSEDELKDAQLDEQYFGATCDGYPALLWQTGVTFHGKDEGTVTAPTCEAQGYTTYTCTNETCGKTFVAAYVNALGHDWCVDATGCDNCVYTAPTCTQEGSIVRDCRRDGCDVTHTDVVPATGHTADKSQTVDHDWYADCVCSVCGERYVVYYDARAQYVAQDGLSNIAFTDNTYPWVWNAETQRFESGNKGVHSSTSQTSMTVTLSKAANVSFAYGVSSESGYDKLTVSADIGEQTVTIADAISGTSESTFTYDLPAGTYTLTFAYSKDGGASSGQDLGWFSNFVIAKPAPANNAPALAAGVEATASAAITLGESYTADLSGIFTDADEGDTLTYQVKIGETEAVAAQANYTYTPAEAGTYTLVFTANDGEATSPAYTVTLTVEAAQTPDVPGTDTALTDVYENVKAALETQANGTAPIVGAQKGEWLVIGLTRAESDTTGWDEAYYAKVLAQNITNNQLHSAKSTENARVILALTALGYDPTDVNGHNLLAGFTDMTYVSKQGVNGPIWALIALDSKDYAEPNTNVTRDALIDAILAAQLNDGGWALNSQGGDPADPDMTGMALTALAPYYSTNDRVKTAVDKALACLSGKQNADGSFSSGGDATAESCAQVIVALSALGIDADTDARFIKNGKSVLDALLTYHVDGGFEHIAGGSKNTMATEQGFYALVAYNRFVSGKTALFDMSDVAAREEEEEQPATAEAVKAAMEALEVEEADKKTYEAIQAILEDYSKLTRVEKAAIAETYEDFLDKEEDFEDLLDDAIDDAKLDLEDIYSELDPEDYSEENWDEIRALYRQYRDLLKDARYTEEIADILEEFENEIYSIKTGSMEVTFRLIGDFRHDDGVDGHDEYVTWIETTEYYLAEGSTVYDLLLEALEDAGLSQKGASKNYVESIKAPKVFGGYWLSEFDNGPNSGWMYTVNGDHPGEGLKDWELEDGDEVIWHYVDDYTLEERKSSSKYYERWLEADDISPETYIKRHLEDIVTIEGEGKVTPTLKSSHIGKDVTFKFEPEEGWVIRAVYVDGKNKGAIESYEYEDLSMSSRIEVIFAEAATQEWFFIDVPAGEWYYEDVYYAVENGLFNGTGEYTFSPKAPMTRAMLVTVLYRLEGEPSVYGSSAFSDVAEGLWYSDAVLWAARNGIVTGYTNGKFGVNDNITREQMAAILYRYAQYKGYDVTDRADLSGYGDAPAISAYAVEALSWANAEGLVNGRTADTLAPAGTATRAEVAAIFHRFVENIVK